ERLPLHAESGNIEPAGGRGHVLDGAAGGAERHRPERVGAGPVGQEIEPGGNEILRFDRHDRRRAWAGLIARFLGSRIDYTHANAARCQTLRCSGVRMGTKPSISMVSSPEISLSWRKAPAQGIMNTVSISKMMNSMATR